jgi:hypothetical protein
MAALLKDFGTKCMQRPKRAHLMAQLLHCMMTTMIHVFTSLLLPRVKLMTSRAQDTRIRSLRDASCTIESNCRAVPRYSAVMPAHPLLPIAVHYSHHATAPPVIRWRADCHQPNCHMID